MCHSIQVPGATWEFKVIRQKTFLGGSLQSCEVFIYLMSGEFNLMLLKLDLSNIARSLFAVKFT